MANEALILETLDDTLRREGGKSNHAADRGGATNFGITLKTASEVWDMKPDDPQLLRRLWALTEQQARAIYRSRYMEGTGFTSLFDGILFKLVVDTGINNGRGRAIQWLQRVAGVKEDGALGPNTRAALVLHSTSQLYHGVLACRNDCYADLVRNHHEQAVFVPGWMKRVSEFIRMAA